MQDSKTLKTMDPLTRDRTCNTRVFLVIGACTTINLILGTQYTYANMSPYVISYIRARSSPSDIRYVDFTWITASNMIGRGVVMVTGGILERKLGPRLAISISSAILCAGIFLSYFTVQHSYIATVVTYGVLFGIGSGMAIPIPFGCAMRWLHKRRGIASGLLAAGFCFGNVIFNPIITAYINPDNYSPDRGTVEEMYFSQADLLDRVPRCFLLLGGTYAGVLLACCFFVVNPPAAEQNTVPYLVKYSKHHETATGNENKGYIDSGQKDEISFVETIRQDNVVRANSSTDASPTEDIHPLAGLRGRNFYVFWLILMLGRFSDIFLATQYKNYGLTFINDDQFLSAVASASSVSSGLGSVCWGYILDRFSAKVALRGAVGGTVILTASVIGCEYGGKEVFFVWACLFFFVAVAGLIGLVPPVASKLYGNKYVSVYFGLLYSSQIVTGAAGAFLGQLLKDYIGWHGMFYTLAGITGLGFLLIFFLDTKTPAGKEF